MRLLRFPRSPTSLPEWQLFTGLEFLLFADVVLKLMKAISQPPVAARKGLRALPSGQLSGMPRDSELGP